MVYLRTLPIEIFAIVWIIERRAFSMFIDLSHSPPPSQPPKLPPRNIRSRFLKSNRFVVLGTSIFVWVAGKRGVLGRSATYLFALGISGVPVSRIRFSIHTQILFVGHT